MDENKVQTGIEPPAKLSEAQKKEAEKRRKAKALAKAYREKYFQYYDDVKTKIKEDW